MLRFSCKLWEMECEARGLGFDFRTSTLEMLIVQPCTNFKEQQLVAGIAKKI